MTSSMSSNRVVAPVGAGHLGVDERGDHVVRRVGAPTVTRSLKYKNSSAPAAAAPVGLVGRPVVPVQQLVGQLLQRALVVCGRPEQPGDHGDRQLAGEVPDDLSLPRVRHRVEPPRTSHVRRARGRRRAEA